jgi:hypothetical protein
MAIDSVPRETIELTRIELARIAGDVATACENRARARSRGDRAAARAYLRQIDVLTRVALALAADVGEGPS